MQEKSLAEIFAATRLSEKEGSDRVLVGIKTAPYGFVPSVESSPGSSAVVPAHPLLTIAGRDGPHADMPLIMGTNKDDGGIYLSIMVSTL